MLSDIAILSKRGEPILLVEVKNKTGTSKDWAAKLRRNIMAHGVLPKAPYFLVATPDHFYLWKDASDSVKELEPSYEIDPNSIPNPLFTPGEEIGPVELETKVASWLNRIMSSQPEHTNGSIGDLLSRSGLREAIKGGRLAFESQP